MTTISAYARAGITNAVMENMIWQISLINSNPEVARIIRAMEEVSGFQYVELCTGNRQRKYSIPRQVTMVFLRERTTLTVQNIARLFNLHHSTLAWAVKSVALMEFDNQLRWFYHQMEKKLGKK